MTIKCILAGMNYGQPGLFFAKVNCTEVQYLAGKHYDTMRDAAAEEGYEEPCVVFDENDAGGQLVFPIFNWDNAPIFSP